MSTLSIVIPTKNEEEFLPYLLRSLDWQTKQPDAVIVADAQSTDRTREIVREYDAEVVEGGMPGPGRNAGARHAKTDLIFFFDADVVLDDPQFLEKAVREFDERGIDVATADIKPDSSRFIDRIIHGFYNKYVRFWGKRHAHAPGFCLLARRSLHEAIGGFDETVVFCEDHDYALRGSKIGTFGILSSVVISVSTRRLDRDGRLNIGVKYTLSELHLLTIGPVRHNLFNYTFGYPKQRRYGRKK